MILSIKERLSIIQLLPEEGSIADMIDIMEIMKKVRIDQTEKDRIGYTELKEIATWNIALDEGKEVEFKYEEIAILKTAVQKLDAAKKVTPANVGICVKINAL